jgi:hypothetical protein
MHFGCALLTFGDRRARPASINARGVAAVLAEGRSAPPLSRSMNKRASEVNAKPRSWSGGRRSKSSLGTPTRFTCGVRRDGVVASQHNIPINTIELQPFCDKIRRHSVNAS